MLYLPLHLQLAQKKKERKETLGGILTKTIFFNLVLLLIHASRKRRKVLFTEFACIEKLRENLNIYEQMSKAITMMSPKVGPSVTP